MLSLSAASGSAKPGQGAALAAAASSSDTSSASPASLEQSARSGSPGSTPAAAPSSSSAEKNMHGRPVAQNGSRVNAGYVNRPAPGKSNGEDAVDAHASGAVAYAALGDGVGVSGNQIYNSISLITTFCSVAPLHSIYLSGERANAVVLFCLVVDRWVEASWG